MNDPLRPTSRRLRPRCARRRRLRSRPSRPSRRPPPARAPRVAAPSRLAMGRPDRRPDHRGDPHGSRHRIRLLGLGRPAPSPPVKGTGGLCRESRRRFPTATEARRTATVCPTVTAARGSGGSASGSGSSGSGGPSNISSIASAVAPGLVDLNVTLAYGNGQAAATGIVISSTGEVITNNHVVQGAGSISATDVGNGKTYKATVVGYDRSHDIAVLQLSGASGLRRRRSVTHPPSRSDSRSWRSATPAAPAASRAPPAAP